MKDNICQSCGMPLEKDPKGGGTRADGSLSDIYCSYCFVNGQFTDEGITLEEKIEKNVRIASSVHMDPEEARKIAWQILPALKRWNGS